MATTNGSTANLRNLLRKQRHEVDTTTAAGASAASSNKLLVLVLLLKMMAVAVRGVGNTQLTPITALGWAVSSFRLLVGKHVDAFWISWQVYRLTCRE